jgi:flavodoxin
MMGFPKVTRREALVASFLPLAAGAKMEEVHAQSGARGSSVLVAYFTRTGNTRLIATQISRALGTQVFQIEPATPYPEDYKEQVAQAESERQRGYEPPLKATVPDFASYDVVFLGFPVWGTTAPSIIRSFLSAHDVADKTLVPFITHGGYGPGSSIEVLSQHAPRAQLVAEFVKQCDQERETLEQVTQWLGGIDARR